MNDNPCQVQIFGYRKPRFLTDLHILIQTSAPNVRLIDARCIDISEDGLAARLSEPLTVDSHVVFILTLPGSSTSVRIDATVNNRQQDTCGFKFIFSSREDRALIHRYIAHLRIQAACFPSVR